MVRHIVMLELVESHGPRDVDRILEAVGGLPGSIPEIRSYSASVDLGLAAGNAQVCIVADFDDVAGYEAYRDHPEHQRVISEAIKPVLASRSAVQIAL